MLHRSSADQLPHHPIKAELAGVVDVFVSGQPREDRLPHKTGKTMTAILSGSGVGDVVHGQLSQAERVVQFTMRQQTAIRTDR